MAPVEGPLGAGHPRPRHSDQEVRAWFTDVVLATKEVWVADVAGAVARLLVLEDDWLVQGAPDVRYEWWPEMDDVDLAGA